MLIALNQRLVISGVEYFNDQAAINPFMDASVPIDLAAAAAEHVRVRQAYESAGITVYQVPPPTSCQDGVYTANWGLERDNTVVLARLPNARKAEEAYAAEVLRAFGKTIIYVPGDLHFSGQGDALPCGEYVFCGQGYRSDAAAQAFMAERLGYNRIQLQTVPLLDSNGRPVINSHSGWPDSFFYDLDLALAILRPPVGDQKGLIAWCPDAFVPASQFLLHNLDAVEKIAVSLQEAKGAYACNLVSTGETVIMNQGAPELQAAIEAHGLRTITLNNPELAKGGGSIRCVSMCISNS
ncbi:MAG TPA: hypothetical protein VMB52_01550 [Verrucomicrobiae bacterium]|nr:hypothetical protein [Verrucomicrobiae bacterium]